MNLDTIAPLSGPAPDGATKATRKVSQPRAANRRGFLGGALAAGTTIGMAALGVFPAARRAMADGYDIRSTCPTNYPQDCEPGCGPSPTCNVWDCCTVNLEWHKDSSYIWWLLRPNQCPSGSGYDGWLWKWTTFCGGCNFGVTWRCHDGWTWTGSQWAPTICRRGWCN